MQNPWSMVNFLSKFHPLKNWGGPLLDSNGVGLVGIQIKKHGVLRMSEFIQPSRLT